MKQAASQISAQRSPQRSPVSNDGHETSPESKRMLISEIVSPSEAARSSPPPLNTLNFSPTKRFREEERHEDLAKSPERGKVQGANASIAPLGSSSANTSPIMSSTSASSGITLGTSNAPSGSNALSSLVSLSDEQIDAMEASLVRLSLKSAVSQVRALQESSDRLKTLVSQLELQNKLLTIENHNSAQRYEVENGIVKREVDRLRMDAATTSHASHPAGLSDAEVYRRRLQKAKIKLREASKEIEEKVVENEKLRKRLREGRLHREAVAAAVRDQQQQQQFFQSSPHSHRHHDSEGGLAALGMLASQVLSQQSSPHKGLMSPVEFNGSPEKKRRESSASTITIPSEDDEDDDFEKDEQALLHSDEEDDPNRTLEETPSRSRHPSPVSERHRPKKSSGSAKKRKEARSLPIAKVLF